MPNLWLLATCKTTHGLVQGLLTALASNEQLGAYPGPLFLPLVTLHTLARGCWQHLGRATPHAKP